MQELDAKTLLQPLHVGAGPLGASYPNTMEVSARNDWIGRRELGLPTDDVESPFGELMGEASANRVFTRIKREFALI